MRKIQLNIDALEVTSFATAEIASVQGTVNGHEPTRGNNQECASAVDACPSRLCDTINLCESAACETYDLCPSAYDACPTRLC